MRHQRYFGSCRPILRHIHKYCQSLFSPKLGVAQSPEAIKRIFSSTLLRSHHSAQNSGELFDGCAPSRVTLRYMVDYNVCLKLYICLNLVFYKFFIVRMAIPLINFLAFSQLGNDIS